MSLIQVEQVEIVSEIDQAEPQGVAQQSEMIEVESSGGEWLTPGSLIAQRVAALPQVRFVAERLEGPRYAVFVILDDDPEDVFDVVFAAEQEIMAQVPVMAFDLRVRKPHAGWSPENLFASCTKHYVRP